jgi:glycosyltransferase involved in cell wall biosynthesis
MSSDTPLISGRRPRVAVATPELHRLGGTERVTAEQVERWSLEFDVRVYVSRMVDVRVPPAGFRTVRTIPGPNLLRYLWWFAGNSLVRVREGRRRPEDVTFSPGVNCLDADAIGIHIVFSKYWRQVRESLALERRVFATLPRALHRTVYVNLIRLLEHHVYTGPALLWTASRADAREVESRFGRTPGSVAVVPHGVDSEAFHPNNRAARRPNARRGLQLKADEVLLLFVGNDLAKKGADLALSALALLPPNVRLAIAGQVPGAEVRMVAERKGVSDRVSVLTHTDDLLTYYAAADVLVAPSREDSFHLPALEAMACGIPVVVSARAGVAELVTPDRDAIVLQDPSHVDTIVSAIERIIGDPQFAQELASNGRALAERCTWDVNARRTADLIERELRTPRLLVLAPDPGGTGGIQRATRILLRALCDVYGADRVATLAIRNRDEAAVPGRLLRRGRAASGSVRVSHIERARYFAASVATARRWRRRLAVFAAHPHLAPVAWASRLVSGAPYAVWCHGIESWGRLPLFVAMALRAADEVFAPSTFTARRIERVAGLPPGSVRVLPHCTSPEIAAGPSGEPAEPPVVLAVARLTPENRYKGVDTLLYAWPRVLERVQAELLVVGDGPDLPRLRRIAEALDLDGAVRFAGMIPDEELTDAYATSAVFAMPARHRLEPRPQGEGFGLVFIEAGAAGLPVVAGRGGGAEEAVEDGGSGILVDARDHRSVARAVVGLLLDPQRGRAMGERGRELATTRFAYDAFRTQVAALVGDLRPKGLW